MKPKRGYYSLIQFCPNVSRLEAVNVGVVLFCPEFNFLDARTSGNNRRAEKLVGRGNLEKSALNAAKRSIERRLDVDRESFKDLDDLRRFVDSRGNWLKLTEPRPVKVFEPSEELVKLYDELVGGPSFKRQQLEEKQLFPSLETTFTKLHSEGRAELDIRVKVPVLSRSINIPYAYQNGSLNLIKPHRFSSRENSSEGAAMRLAMEGDLLQRHGTDHGVNARLIVVSAFDIECSPGLVRRVSSLFGEYDIKNVAGDEIDEFIASVEIEAH